MWLRSGWQKKTKEALEKIALPNPDVSGSTGYTFGAFKRLFEDVADFEAAVCDDADATDDTDEDITEPEGKCSASVENVIDVTTKCETKENWRSTWEDYITKNGFPQALQAQAIKDGFQDLQAIYSEHLKACLTRIQTG